MCFIQAALANNQEVRLSAESLIAPGEVVAYKAARVGQVVDPTGAGDVFFGAYLFSRLHERQSIRESCEHAALVAAQQVQGRYITQETLQLAR